MFSFVGAPGVVNIHYFVWKLLSAIYKFSFIFIHSWQQKDHKTPSQASSAGWKERGVVNRESESIAEKTASLSSSWPVGGVNAYTPSPRFRPRDPPWRRDLPWPHSLRTVHYWSGFELSWTYWKLAKQFMRIISLTRVLAAQDIIMLFVLRSFLIQKPASLWS